MTRLLIQHLVLAVVATFFALIVVPVAEAQSVSRDTLVVSDVAQILNEIRIANPALEAAGLYADRLSRRPAQIGSLPDPTVGVSVQPVPVVTARGSQRSQWQVQQAFPFPGKLKLREEASRWEAEAAHRDVDRLRLDLVEYAKLAWHDLLQVLRQERLVREFQASLRNFEEVARTRYAVGAEMQQAVLKAQVERNALSNKLLELERLQRSLIESLSKLADRPIGLSDSLVIAPDLPAPSPATDDLLASALAQRPESHRLDALLQRADAMIELARKEWLPDFAVGLTYFDIADTRLPASADGRDALAVGLSVKIPLQRGRLRSRLEETELMHRQLDAQRRSLETSYRTEIADFVQQISNERRQLELFQDGLIPQARTALAASVSAYSTGRASFLDLLDAERMLFDLRWSLETTRTSLLQSVTRLERATGYSAQTALHR